MLIKEEKKLKNVLTIVFSKSDFAGAGSFCGEKNSEKAKTLGICQVSVVKWVILDSKNVL